MVLGINYPFFFVREQLQDRKDQITNVLNKAKKEAAEQ